MLTTLPIILPLLAAGLCVLFWRWRGVQFALSVGTTAAMFVVSVTLLITVHESGTRVVELGGWAAPAGITLVADSFACLMLSLASLVGLAVMISAVSGLDRELMSNGFAPLVLCLLAAVSGAFLAGDLFNLYVWFELMLLSSFVLLTLGGGRERLEGAIKYVALNLLSSVLFLASIGLIYAVTGTLNMAHLAIRLDAMNDPALATVLGAPLLVAFGIKAAVFPVFFWLPASYHTPPPLVSALFAGLLTKVGVYAIIRALTLLFDQQRGALNDAVLIIAGLTMITGVLGAIAQNDMRRILSFHIVSQIGYMLMGLGIAMRTLSMIDDGAADPALLAAAGIAMTGSVFYIMHHIIVKANLFLIANAVIFARGESALEKVSGVARTNPVLGALFLVSALSLAGIPALSGFWAKLALVRGGLETGAYAIVAVSLVVSLLTLLSMMKIWTQAFWGKAETGGSHQPATGAKLPATTILPIAAMATLTVTIGLGAGPAYTFTARIGEQLLNPNAYIEAVLPGYADQPDTTVEAAR